MNTLNGIACPAVDRAIPAKATAETAAAEQRILPEVFPGYRVEPLEEREEFSIAYKVTGPRKTFYLMRNRVNPCMLFVCPVGGGGGRIRGYEWFTDKDGTLRPAR